MDNGPGLKMIFLLKMGIFHCYVSLPEGTCVVLISYLEDGIPGLGYVVIGSPPFISHEVRPFGRGPTNRSLGDENDHHGY